MSEREGVIYTGRTFAPEAREAIRKMLNNCPDIVFADSEPTIPPVFCSFGCDNVLGGQCKRLPKPAEVTDEVKLAISRVTRIRDESSGQ